MHSMVRAPTQPSKTGAGAGNHSAPLPFCQLRDWQQSENERGRIQRRARQDAA